MTPQATQSYLQSLGPQVLAQMVQARLQVLIAQKKQAALVWPEVTSLRNRETGKSYAYHHDGERRFVHDDTPRYMLAKGGEGGGKSVAGIVKTLFKLSRGISPGVMGSPDFEHFKKSLWPEFRRWCPWDYVIPSQRHRAALSWNPPGPFDLIFDGPRGQVALTCGGFDDPAGWEGPNLAFAYFDEARRHKTPSMLKVLDGRCRIVGPNGEPPQIWLTSTPRKHWMFEYFGPVADNDSRAAFKRDSFVIDLLTAGNADNLSPGFVDQRRQTLTEAEARVLLEAAWEDIDTADRFLPSMSWWDACQEALPSLTRHEPMVIGLDAGTKDDNFGLVAVTRHPHRHDEVAVRHVQAWRPVGGVIDFRAPGGPREVLNALIDSWNVVQVCYDPSQLHDMMTELFASGRVYVAEFNQGAERLVADRLLYDLITQRRIAHPGDAALRQHIDNANAKPDPDTRKIRIVKREPSLKIDLAVALSMAAKRCLDLAV